MNRTIIFDVCGTLFFSNTTFDFVKYYHMHKKNKLKSFFIKRLTGNLGKVMHRFLNISIRKLIISTLKGELVSDVEYLAAEFVRSNLENKKIESIFNEFTQLKKNNNVVLVSASIEPVIKSIAELYGVYFQCSELEIKNEKYTGIISKDLKGNKHLYIDSASAFYSDNLDDLACSFMVENFYFIRHKMSNRYKAFDYSENVEVINV
ncbi:haloacid dehalogenase-like hydrolase [Pseudoalteromonas sp. SR41-1]|uniref:haloacid dehalogenase-like hydrolase n=1 Tax=Pseudoalteromonas sp. SR41-1 TaxID=2760952 RepID=UPI001601D05E|nr:haloacid dehalogenase-like hydrolase [Pseudoalteromonas sp. SR41-1]MBB1279842.1 haloacid dehalogenase-like hydrolase [Pseudoalteromonas sp. SR41-1]